MENKMFLICGTIDNGASFEPVRVIACGEDKNTAEEYAKTFVENMLHNDEFFTISDTIEIETVNDGVLYYKRGNV